GPWAPYISQFVDVYLPIFPTRAHQLLTPPLEPITGPFLITAAWDFGSSQHADGRVQFGGGDVLDDSGRVTFSKRILPRRVDEIARRLREQLSRQPSASSSPARAEAMSAHSSGPTGLAAMRTPPGARQVDAIATGLPCVAQPWTGGAPASNPKRCSPLSSESR